MSEEPTQGAEQGAEGQPTGAPEGASAGGSQPASGQPEGGGKSATGDGHQADTIFDPAEYNRLTDGLPENLKAQAGALQKQLVAAYTKKTQAIASDRKKIEAYDAFNKNPMQFMERFAKQMGMTLQRNEHPATEGGSKKSGWNPDTGDPQSWGDVVEFLKDSLRNEFGGQLQPMVQEFQNIKRQSIEHQLSEIDPGWQQYEDAMMETLGEHPTLARDPAKLYRLSVPSEILESRATQRALAKMEAKTKSSKVQGTSTTNKKTAATRPSGTMNFAEAVAAAKQKIAEDGIAA